MPATTNVTKSAAELRNVLGRLVRRLRAENSFPLSHGTVLARLERDGPQTTSALAAAERVRPQSMAHTIAELKSAGYVARRPHPLDRRQILIELTDEGLARFQDDRRRREGWLAEAIATQLSADEQEILAQAVPLLDRLTHS
ncbi:MAG TPA: MarR family transcriptional regulator [Gaiellaceae bacterium]|nr:MarR family transcriptional regulator [Gaiellaceae bacterium]